MSTARPLARRLSIVAIGGFCTALTSVVDPLPAWAQQAKKEGKQGQNVERPVLVVGNVGGPQSAKVRGWMISALEEGGDYVVVSDGVASEVGFDSPESEIAEAAKAAQASAVIAGKVARVGRGWQLQVRVHSGADGKRIDEVSLKAANPNKLKAEVDGSLGVLLADPLAYAKPPAQAVVEPEPEPEKAAPEPEPEPVTQAAPTEPDLKPSPLRVRVGARGQSRRFRYNDQLHDFQATADELPGYQLDAAPAAFIDVQYYPGAHLTGGWLANVGLYAGYEKAALFTQSSLEDTEGEPRLISTSSDQWFVGARLRVPVDLHEAGLEATVGAHGFSVGTEADDELLRLPGVTWNFFRVGADIRFEFGDTFAGAGFGVRIADPSGEFNEIEWFPDATALGVDATIFAGVHLTRAIDLLAGFELRRYAFAGNSLPGDIAVAGGGVDEYPAAWGALAFTLPGESRASLDPDMEASE